MSIHSVKELEWAQWASSPFTSSPRGRTVSQRLGLAFQYKVGKALSMVDKMSGPWIRFCDRSGIHFAQPDFLLQPRLGQPILVEVKLTFRQEAFAQMENLYLPLLEKLLGFRPCPVVVCKNLGTLRSRPTFLSSLRSCKDFFPFSVLAWDGKTPLALED